MNSLIRGRMNRATYWLLLSIVVVVYALLVTYVKKPPGIAEILIILLGVPRLHDIGRSGWWLAILFGLEIVGIVIAFATLPVDGVMIVGGLIVMLMLIVMMILGCIRGQPGPNKYGEAPGPGLSFLRTST